MKKTFIAIITAGLLALGLVAATGGTASAACPYSACLATSTTASAKSVVAGAKTTVKVKVTSSGNVAPTGTVKVSIKRKGGGFSSSASAPYSGATVKIKSAKLNKKGNYKVTVKFVPTTNSTFNPSKATTSFKVK